MLCRGKILILFSSGLVTTSVGVVMYLVFPIIMDYEIEKRLVLKEGSESYKEWKNIPVPIYLHFYFFNVTNTEEVYNHKEKPILQQLGPYTFREEREKVITAFNENGTLTYRQIRRWYYDSDRTNGSLDDIVTTLNVPMVAAASKAKKLNTGYVYFALEELFDFFKSAWFVQKPVRELLFEGYRDPLMKLAKKFIHIPYDKFGWFYQRNGTDDGVFNIFTGAKNVKKVDEINSWNGLKRVPSYSSPCNMINGSAGDMWPPHFTTSSKVTMFVTDICRSVSFTYLKSVDIQGVRTYRYWADETQLDNGKYNPENRCFCEGEVCLPAGVLNVSLCKFDAPAVVSYPHFLTADPIYREGVIGMNPDPEKHRMYLDIVPELGVPLGVAARMQINIIFEAIPEIKQFTNITKRIYFPVLWFSETADTDDDISSRFRFILNTIPLISEVFSIILISIGIILTLAALILYKPFSCNKNESSYTVVVPSE